MAAAYAALLSLSNVLHQILNPPPNPHFIIPTEQIENLWRQVDSLINYLEKYSYFLEKYCTPQIELLEKQIVEAVCRAEDTIESNVVRQIQAKSAIHRSMKQQIKNILSFRKVLKKKAVLELIKKFYAIERISSDIEKQNPLENVRVNSAGASSSRSVAGGKNIMIGFDKHLEQVMSHLASDETSLLIVPIVGMGGIGKTTLAANVYKHPFIVDRFETRAWVSVSPEYKERDIVLALLKQINSEIQGNGFDLSGDKIEVLLHKQLFGMRYLIVLDDLWDIQAFEYLKPYLPERSDKSRILVTTRDVKLAADFQSCDPYCIDLLGLESSWELIHEYVFGSGETFPIELVEIGKSIAKGCGGLPLALVVISGLLVKSEKTRDFWEYVNENVTTAANHANDEHCLRILRLSYIELPVHLKPCFLYFSVFPKDFEIRRSRLIRLLIAEGFIKPSVTDCLEEVAGGYLQDLSDRNLIMIGKRGHTGKVKNYNIHDLIRELCMKEAQKNKFLCIQRRDASNSSPPLKSVRRISIHAGVEKKTLGELRAGKYNRSFLSYSACESSMYLPWHSACVPRRLNPVRVFDVADSYSMDEILRLINSRYIACGIPREFPVSSLVSLPLNLQTFVFPVPISLPVEFWQMVHLRHLKMPEITLADPLDVQVYEESFIVLENLQTLSTVKDFVFSENVVRRMPNLKKLGIDCEATEGVGSYYLSNLASLHKLESLVIKSRGTWERMPFPISVKKLTLSGCHILWDDMSVVGALPNLEVLKLRNDATKGQTWIPNQGGFRRLKFLSIDWCPLESWEADDSHFPSLEHLQLIGVRMEEFPMEFAEIEALRTITLNNCSKSLLLSAREMAEFRKNNYDYEEIQIQSFPKETQLWREYNIVGLKDEEETLIKYIYEESEKLDVISIVGMPGLGKTTLAWKIYHNKKIQFDFPIVIWVYVSQDFNMKEVLRTILKKFTKADMFSLDDQDLTLEVRKKLENKKYLLFLDDVWTVKDWKVIEAALPKNNKYGKVLITSRDAEVAAQANCNRQPHDLRLLNIEESWELLQLEVFGKNNGCPKELENFGKTIAYKCGGVPLAVVVIGGILGEECADRKELWKKVSESVSTYVQDKQTQNIISLSYKRLPHELRDCFLYLGVFPEDTEIPVWKLIRLWIAEGFVQQNVNGSLEEVAEENLNELVARNLVKIEKTKANGAVKSLRVHDMIREFCQNVAASAHKNMFQEVKKTRPDLFHPNIPDIEQSCRLCVHSDVAAFLQRRPKGPEVQSFLCFSKENISLPIEHISIIPEAFSLLRVMDAYPINFTIFPIKITKLVHLRYLTLSVKELNALPEPVSKLLNLQTVKINTDQRELEIEADIGKMKQLRHFKTKAGIVLKEMKGDRCENLQTLSRLSIRSCTKEVFSMAPNLKNLGVRGNLNALVYEDENSLAVYEDDNSLTKLECLEKLKLVHDTFPNVPFEMPLSLLPPSHHFPPRLRILTLSSTYLYWTEMRTLGSLHNLEVLKLKEAAFNGRFWLAEGQGFPRLESLHIARSALEIWVASEDAFPKLKNLVLKNCSKLQEIPLQLAKTLELVDVELVSPNLVESARKIEAAKQEMQSGVAGAEMAGFKLKVS